jgi:hypothetical protein
MKTLCYALASSVFTTIIVLPCYNCMSSVNEADYHSTRVVPTSYDTIPQSIWFLLFWIVIPTFGSVGFVTTSPAIDEKNIFRYIGRAVSCFGLALFLSYVAFYEVNYVRGRRDEYDWVVICVLGTLYVVSWALAAKVVFRRQGVV